MRMDSDVWGGRWAVDCEGGGTVILITAVIHVLINYGTRWCPRSSTNSAVKDTRTESQNYRCIVYNYYNFRSGTVRSVYLGVVKTLHTDNTQHKDNMKT